MRRFLSFIFLIFVSLNFNAQDIEVKKFEPMTKDQAANVESKEGYQWNDVWISEGLIKEGLGGCKKYF
jgi:hypothetical protein